MAKEESQRPRGHPATAPCESAATRVRTLSRGRGYRSFAHQNQEPTDQGICERFHKTVLNEFYHVAFRKKVYRSIDDLQRDLDSWITEYNEARPHQGRWCFGKTPMQPFLDAIPMTKDKMIAANPTAQPGIDCQIEFRLIQYVKLRSLS
jgi:hypothetical protein